MPQDPEAEPKSKHAQASSEVRANWQNQLHNAVQEGWVEAAAFWRDAIAFRDRLHIGDEFWADAVKRLKREQKYLEAAALCKQAMPVPAAFDEILICLRKLYVSGTDNRALMGALYRCAVESQAVYLEPYVQFETRFGKDGLPGFNVTAIVWEWLKERPLKIDYQELGYLNVASLNKTDRVRLVEAFGEPRSHGSPRDLCGPLWKEGVQELARREECRIRESRAEYDRILGRPPRD